VTMNAADVVLGRHDPGRVALVHGTERMTSGALRDAVARAGSAWRARGLAHGERVAIKLSDGFDWVAAFLGTIWAGGVAVAVNPRIPAEEWQAILAGDPFRFILAESREDTPPGDRDRVVLLDEWLREAAAAPTMPPEPMDEEAAAFWTHSSGTTGKPKAVMHAQRFALHIERVSAECLGVRPDDRLFASSKMFFSYPLANSLFAGLKIGATVILDSQWPTAANVAATIAAQRPTVMFSVPSLYRNLLREGLAAGIAQSGVRMCVSAGEALPPSLAEDWRRQTGIAIVNGYGASETMVLVLVDKGDGRGARPSPGVEIVPLYQDGTGAPTRILIRAGTVALGYWHRPDAQAEHFFDGGFCPSDLFTRTEDGAYRFGGRDDSLVKVSGRWVDLIELEERIAVACPALVEAAAVTVPDDDGVEAVVVFYVVGADSAEDAGRVLHAHAQTLPHYQRPQRMHAVAALPRTATGKLMRRRLREMHRKLA
jgi:acyl-coenzyme A synthetase/AMP-(fatty) acid ligase